MAQNRKLSIHFYLILLVSLFGGLLEAAQQYNGLSHLKELISNPHALGMIFGYAFGAMLCGYILALVINFIFNLFRKEKKSFSHFWIWLFVIIYFLGTLGYRAQLATQITPEMKQKFEQSCIDKAKTDPKFLSLSPQQQSDASDKINDLCHKSMDQFFDSYSKCMDESGKLKYCLNQAIYEQCMQMIKQDSDYCHTVADQGAPQ